jgi:hypothetical protein
VRYGVSWGPGGRREWVSASCLGWLILAPFIAVVYVAGFAAVAVLGVALALAWLARGVWLGCRLVWRRWHARRPGRAR